MRALFYTGCGSQTAQWGCPELFNRLDGCGPCGCQALLFLGFTAKLEPESTGYFTIWSKQTGLSRKKSPIYASILFKDINTVIAVPSCLPILRRRRPTPR